MGKAISFEIKKNWKKMYESGLTLREIAKVSGCSKQAVGKYLKSLGVEMKNRGYINILIKKNWVKMYKEGLSLKKIGEMYGCSITPVRKYLNSVGCNIRNREIDISIKEQWVGLYLDGLCYKDIARVFNCGNGIVEKYIKGSGIKTRTLSEGVLNSYDQGKANGGGVGWTTEKGGYIRMTKAGDTFGMLEHRVIMEKHLGRKLSDKEIVHHVDCNTKNNTTNNLKVMTVGEHNKLHGQIRKHEKKQLKDDNKRLRNQVLGLQNEVSKLRGLLYTSNDA